MSKMVPNSHFDPDLALTHIKQLKYIIIHILKVYVTFIFTFMISIMTRQLIIKDTSQIPK